MQKITFNLDDDEDEMLSLDKAAEYVSIPSIGKKMMKSKGNTPIFQSPSVDTDLNFDFFEMIEALAPPLKLDFLPEPAPQQTNTVDACWEAIHHFLKLVCATQTLDSGSIEWSWQQQSLQNTH
jgi:hypothetical protein